VKVQERYLSPEIAEFLMNRMVFVGGPRQVGKTTLCLSFLENPISRSPAYLNWDVLSAKKIIKSGNLPPNKIILFDEIHKFKNWRNLLKGFYDSGKDFQKYIVTGSARLDHYRKGGDSLLGRYRYLRLHPFSIPELKLQSKKDVEQLLRLGGFPEPFLNGKEKTWKLWTRERLHRIVNDDIRDLENLREYSLIEVLAETLPSKIGSPLSIQSLSEDLEVNFRTAEHWIQILEKVYYCFRILPYGSPKIRAVKKERKLYLWDWSECETDGSRFENFVASHLLKYCHHLEDSQGEKMELRFLRDTSRREIDFVVLKNKKPIFAVECKTGEKSVSPHLLYFRQRTDIPRFYQVHLGERDFVSDGNIRVLPFSRFCVEVGLV
jgi:predicted AAA+ superfamily ATPase